MKKGVSLRGRVVLVFTAVVLAITALFLLMNLMFWNIININSSKRTLKSTYLELCTLVAGSDITTDEFLDYVTNAKESNNIDFCLQGDEDWEFMVVTRQAVSDVELNFLMERLQDNFLNSSPDATIRIIETGTDYVIQDVTTASGRHYLECYGYMRDANGEDKKFILSMSMSFLSSVTRVYTGFFLYVALIGMILGILSIELVTYRITRPIYQLTDISKRMSRLDFSARYTGDQKDEVGVLGNNMNEMASQLERTFLQLQLANEQLKADLQEKEQVDEMRKDFISNVSHELKTPIALIQGYAEGLKDFGREDPESMDYYCDVIADEAEKMNRLVKKLTTLNQLEFGNDGLEITSFDIMEMIRNIENGSKKMQADKKATVRISGPDHCMVLGDEYKIEEVFNNYYSNAFNHLEAPNEIDITFDDLGPNIRISVKNTGENIPESEMEHIWIKFYKVDKARTRSYGGSGIGLSIVKAIMDAHKQEFGVYNVDGGVVFWFEIEKLPEEKEENEGPEAVEDDAGVMNGEILGEV